MKIKKATTSSKKSNLIYPTKQTNIFNLINSVNWKYLLFQLTQDEDSYGRAICNINGAQGPHQVTI